MKKFYRSPSRKLSEEDAKEVLQLHRLGWFQNRIAAKFDVNPARINDIIKGRTFGHLTQPDLLANGGMDAPSLFEGN